MSRGPAPMTGRTRFRDVRFRDMPEASGWLRHYGGAVKNQGWPTPGFIGSFLARGFARSRAMNFIAVK
jgi:hypothetical protein